MKEIRVILNYKVYMICDGYHADFMIYETIADTGQEISEPIVVGHVSHLGYTNWSVKRDLSGYVGQDIIGFGDMLRECYRWASSVLPNFDGNRI